MGRRPGLVAPDVPSAAAEEECIRAAMWRATALPSRRTKPSAHPLWNLNTQCRRRTVCVARLESFSYSAKGYYLPRRKLASSTYVEDVVFELQKWMVHESLKRLHFCGEAVVYSC